MELTGIGFLLTITYCSLTVALPTGYSQLENMSVRKFAEMINDIRNKESRKDLYPVGKSDKSEGIESNQKSRYGIFLPLDGSMKTKDINQGSSENFDQVEKRQGDWDYDYGLGGGRWGKRNYNTYGLAKFRLGRDVDHIDPYDLVD